MPTVAIIGGGCAGLCAARACLENNLRVTIFEQQPTLGGIWTNRVATPVFDNLTTNTSCFETCISDVPPPRVAAAAHLAAHEDLCLTRAEFAAYIAALITAAPSLLAHARCSTRVQAVRFERGLCRVRSVPVDAEAADDVRSETFDRVIVATGMHRTPRIPRYVGLDVFPGDVHHVSAYKRPGQFTGRVLVVGGSVSGCEVAGDMATADAHLRPQLLTLCARKMRYLVAKQSGSRVLRAVTATRFNYLRVLARTASLDRRMEEVRRLVLSFSRNEHFNAPPPDGPIKRPFEPGWVPVNNKLLTASKQRALQWKIAAISRLDRDGFVHFQDATQQQYDTILFATGYKLDLPFLDDETKSLIGASDNCTHLDLYRLALHPDLPNLAFVGMYPPTGAILPPFEAQARMVARLFAHPHEMPDPSHQREWIRDWRKQRSHPDFMTVISGIEVMDPAAKLGGFDVDLGVYPELTKALLFGPMVPAQFRMFGHGCLHSAKEEFIRQVAAAGFEPGDNSVAEHLLEELAQICTVLDGHPDAPKGLQQAYRYLRKVNCS